MIKMIVLDLDGTILNSDKIITKNTKDYLCFLKQLGYIIVIATGRIYSSAITITNKAEFANYIISDTGTSLYDNSNSKPIFINTINQDIVNKILNYYNNDFLYIDICDKDTIYEYSDRFRKTDTAVVTKDKDYIFNACKNICHVSIVMKTNEATLILQEKLKNDICEVDIILMQDSFSDRTWLEIMPRGCS